MPPALVIASMYCDCTPISRGFSPLTSQLMPITGLAGLAVDDDEADEDEDEDEVAEDEADEAEADEGELPA